MASNSKVRSAVRHVLAEDAVLKNRLYGPKWSTPNALSRGAHRQSASRTVISALVMNNGSLFKPTSNTAAKDQKAALSRHLPKLSRISSLTKLTPEEKLAWMQANESLNPADDVEKRIASVEALSKTKSTEIRGWSATWMEERLRLEEEEENITADLDALIRAHGADWDITGSARRVWSASEKTWKDTQNSCGTLMNSLLALRHGLKNQQDPTRRATLQRKGLLTMAALARWKESSPVSPQEVEKVMNYDAKTDGTRKIAPLAGLSARVNARSQIGIHPPMTVSCAPLDESLAEAAKSFDKALAQELDSVLSQGVAAEVWDQWEEALRHLDRKSFHAQLALIDKIVSAIPGGAAALTLDSVAAFPVWPPNQASNQLAHEALVRCLLDHTGGWPSDLFDRATKLWLEEADDARVCWEIGSVQGDAWKRFLAGRSAQDVARAGRRWYQDHLRTVKRWVAGWRTWRDERATLLTNAAKGIIDAWQDEQENLAAQEEAEALAHHRALLAKKREMAAAVLEAQAALEADFKAKEQAEQAERQAAAERRAAKEREEAKAAREVKAVRDAEQAKIAAFYEELAAEDAAEEAARASIINKQRISFRRTLAKERSKEQEQAQREIEQAEAARKAQLDALAASVAPDVAADPQRVRSETVAWKAAVSEERGPGALFPSHTYNDDQVTTDPKWKLASALRTAGISAASGPGRAALESMSNQYKR